MRDIELGKKAAPYVHLSFKQNKVSFLFEPYSNLVHNCKKVKFTFMQANLKQGQTTKVAFMEYKKYHHIVLFLDFKTGKNMTGNKGIGYWLNLTKFLKSHIKHIDIGLLQNLFIEKDKFQKKLRVREIEESTPIKKGELLANLVIKLVTEKAVMVRNRVGGFTPVFEDHLISRVKKGAVLNYWISRFFSQKHAKNVIRLEKDRAYEMYVRRLGVVPSEVDDAEEYNNFEDGKYFSLDKEPNDSSKDSVSTKSIQNILGMENSLLRNKTELKGALLKNDSFERVRKKNQVIYNSMDEKEYMQKSYKISLEEFTGFLEDSRSTLSSFFGQTTLGRARDSLSKKEKRILDSTCTILQRIDNSLFTFVKKVEEKYLIVSFSISLNNYANNLQYLLIGEKPLEVIKQLQLDCDMEIMNSKYNVSNTVKSADRKISVHELLSCMGLEDKYYKAIMRAFLNSKMLGHLKKEMADILEKKLIVSFGKISLDGFGIVLKYFHRSHLVSQKSESSSLDNLKTREAQEIIINPVTGTHRPRDQRASSKSIFRQRGRSSIYFVQFYYSGGERQQSLKEKENLL